MSATDSSCANCGEGEENNVKLKKCSACLSVKYCSAECQKAHRPQHKKICKKRAAELYDEKLFKAHSPNEECPICLLPLPHEVEASNFMSCCGKTICAGCIYSMNMSDGNEICPFCRTPDSTSNEEDIKRLKELMDKGNADAINMFAGAYYKGIYGRPQDYGKANELFLEAGELGCSNAYFNLGNSYYFGQGVEVDTKKARHYYELAAINGDVRSRYNLGLLEGEAGYQDRSFKHLMIAAKAGHVESLDAVKKGYMSGLDFVTKDEYASTLRAYHERQKEMKSDSREKAAASDMFIRDQR